MTAEELIADSWNRSIGLHTRLPAGWPESWKSPERITLESRRRVHRLLKHTDLHQRRPRRKRRGKDICLASPFSLPDVLAHEGGMDSGFDDFLARHQYD